MTPAILANLKPPIDTADAAMWAMFADQLADAGARPSRWLAAYSVAMALRDGPRLVLAACRPLAVYEHAGDRTAFHHDDVRTAIPPNTDPSKREDWQCTLAFGLLARVENTVPVRWEWFRNCRWFTATDAAGVPPGQPFDYPGLVAALPHVAAEFYRCVGRRWLARNGREVWRLMGQWRPADIWPRTRMIRRPVCTKCQGEGGWDYDNGTEPWGEPIVGRVPCDDCDGTGRQLPPCKACRGTGAKGGMPTDSRLPRCRRCKGTAHEPLS